MSSSDSSDSAFFSSFFLSATKNQIKPSNRKYHYRLHTWKLVPIKNVLTSCICLNLLQVRILPVDPRLSLFTDVSVFLVFSPVWMVLQVTLRPFLTCCFGVSQGSFLKAVLSPVIVNFLSITTWLSTTSYFYVQRIYDQIIFFFKLNCSITSFGWCCFSSCSGCTCSWGSSYSTTDVGYQFFNIDTFQCLGE